MNEKITKRVKRIISGSVSALVSAVENKLPEVIMEEALREVESAEEEVRVELGKVIASKHLTNKRFAEKNNVLEEMAEKIELAIAMQKDDLAKTAISQQLDIEAQIPVLEKTITDCIETEKELESYLSALSAKRREMKEELKTFRSFQQETGRNAMDNAVEPGSKSAVQIKINQATSTFERILEKQTGLSADYHVKPARANHLAELEKLSHDHRVEERLKAVKALQRDSQKD